MTDGLDSVICAQEALAVASGLLHDSASRLASERVGERFRGKSASRIPALDSRSAPHLTIRSCFPPYGYPPPHPLHSFPPSGLSPSADSPTLAPPSDAHFHLITIAFDALIDDQRSKGVKGRGAREQTKGAARALSLLPPASPAALAVSLPHSFPPSAATRVSLSHMLQDSS